MFLPQNLTSPRKLLDIQIYSLFLNFQGEQSKMTFCLALSETVSLL